MLYHLLLPVMGLANIEKSGLFHREDGYTYAISSCRHSYSLMRFPSNMIMNMFSSVLSLSPLCFLLSIAVQSQYRGTSGCGCLSTWFGSRSRAWQSARWNRNVGTRKRHRLLNSVKAENQELQRV